MKELPHDWLTQGHIDFEYKKYLLLAYLQEVKKQFHEQRLYPFLSDVVFHYKNMLSIREKGKLLKGAFPKKLSKADMQKLELIYESLVDDEPLMQEINDILSFSIPQMKAALEEGKEVYEFVESKVSLTPVGVFPLYAKEGYLLIQERLNVETQIFRYELTVFASAEENYRALHLHFLDSVRRRIGYTFEHMKMELVRRFPELPNPATYLLDADILCPYQETLIPIAKRRLVRQLSQHAA
ncbi:hypothetical protein [Nafulsella turpanensis]|uniref:hypothetical protein n=1 Tax=Nafulsella turpanensis TaxID=1265690 RepID=UPI000345F8AD|nr:hypothetical protein [Nafulsella turpanensis]